MKFTKILGLAAITAIVAMAFIGASAAQADKFIVLCKVNQTLCEEKNEFPANTPLAGKAENPTLKGTLTEKCNESKTAGETSAKMGEGSLLGIITALSFTGSCSPCTTVTVENLNYLSHLLMTGDLKTGPYHLIVLNGRAHLSGGLFCPSGGCTFEGKEVLLTVEGGSPAKLVATEAPLQKVAGSGLCGETGKWTATYVLSAPTAVWPSLTELK